MMIIQINTTLMVPAMLYVTNGNVREMCGRPTPPETAGLTRLSILYRQNPKHAAARRWPPTHQQPTHCMVSYADHLDCILSVDVFSVKGVDQIVWTRSRFSKSPNLYVEIRMEQSVWCTRTVKRSVQPTWDEEFPMRVRS